MAGTNRIRTTHTGSMPRPLEVLEVMRSVTAGTPYDQVAYEATLSKNVGEIVRKQVEAGIDVVNDGECSKPSFTQYMSERMGGFEVRMPSGGMPVPTGPMVFEGRDAQMFPDYYKLVQQNNPFSNTVRVPPRACVGPIKYVGQEKLRRDINNLKSGMLEAGASDGFMPSASPIPHLKNEFYSNDEDYILAYGDAIREEYKSILDSNLMLQVDFPHLVANWDGKKDMSLADYRKWAEQRVEYLNHALRGLPEDRIRFHTCYGVNFGPRLSDLQLDDVIDIIFKVKASAYSFEAANPRHEHEWRVLERVKLPAGKMLIPGVVTHSSVLVEHQDVVADRMERWIRAAGAENVMFGNDCGFQSTAGNTEIPSTVAWAKLKSLGEGAKIVSKRL